MNFTITEIKSDSQDYAVYQAVIADTGIGMSREFLDTIFEDFSRERSTTEGGVCRKQNMY